VPRYTTKPLEPSTWPAFADLIERHNGVWGGCWCMGFHPEGVRGADHRAQKELRVNNGEAHAALVFDGERCVGWCQFGSPEELTRIKFGKAYREGAGEPPTPPDWRITCFFVDKEHRHSGVAAVRLTATGRRMLRTRRRVRLTLRITIRDAAGRLTRRTLHAVLR